MYSGQFKLGYIIRGCIESSINWVICIEGSINKAICIEGYINMAKCIGTFYKRLDLVRAL